MELGIDEIDDRPVFRNFHNLLLLSFRIPIQQLLNVSNWKRTEFLDGRNTLLLSFGNEFRRDVRKLEELGRTGVNGLEEELLEVHDRDVGGEPVVREGNRRESRTEGKSDRSREVFLCENDDSIFSPLFLRQGQS